MADEPQRFCLGVAYMPGPDPRIAKGVDGGRDFMTEAELEKAAWSFLREGPHVNAFHVAGTEGIATVVESAIHRGPDWDLGDGLVIRKGTWLVGAILEPKAWQAVMDGKANGWSPEGTARRRKVQKEQAVTVAKGAAEAVEDEFSELVDCTFPTMALVGKGANGIPRFLVMKQDGDDSPTGLMDPDFVRDLIAKAEPGSSGRERVEMPSGVTLSGSPADIASFIHKAALERAAAADDVAKAEQSAKTQNDLPDSDFAYIEDGGKKDDEGKTTPRSLRHFPINDAAHVRNALARASSSPFGDKAMPRIRAAAKRFKIDVAKEAGVPGDTIAKADGPVVDEGMDGLDPTVPLAAPDEMPPGDPAVPGSPAWESIDAATACKWMSIAARLKNALCVLADREMIESVTADPSDAEAAWDLQDAMCAVDFVISTLACFAAGEQAEVDLAADTMAAIGKALAGFDPGPLEAVEGYAAVAKAGRVLSAANEAAIRGAADSLNKVLMSLPQAPVADDPVTKEATPVAADQTSTEAAEAAPEPVAKEDAAPQEPQVAPEAAPVAKADSDAPCVVYDGKGQPLGIVDMASITAIQGAAPAMGTMAAGDTKPDDGDDMGDPAPSADDAMAPADDPCPDPADPGDMTPQPAAEAGTPADEAKVAKADPVGTMNISTDQLESIVAKAVAAVLDAQGTAEGIAKSDAAELGAQVETLKAAVTALENSPAVPGVFVNGQTPPANQLRGQDQGAAPVDIAKAAEARTAFRNADPAEQNRLANEMQSAAITQLAALHGRQ